MATVLAIDSLVESSSFRVIELFFYFLSNIYIN